MLPKDPFILLSVINTKLRDNYKNLDVLCEDVDEDKMEIIHILDNAGYTYGKKTAERGAL